MSKHTPGPWTFNDGWLVNEKGKEIVWYTTDDDGIHAEPADARLIAAADDLYEIVRRLLEGWDAECGDVEYLIDDARAAIAKATGETQ